MGLIEAWNRWEYLEQDWRHSTRETVMAIVKKQGKTVQKTSQCFSRHCLARKEGEFPSKAKSKWIDLDMLTPEIAARN